MIHNFVCSGFVVVGINSACMIRLYMQDRITWFATFHQLCTDHLHQVQHEPSSHMPIQYKLQHNGMHFRLNLLH